MGKTEGRKTRKDKGVYQEDKTPTPAEPLGRHLEKEEWCQENEEEDGIEGIRRTKPKYNGDRQPHGVTLRTPFNHVQERSMEKATRVTGRIHSFLAGRQF